MLSRRKAETEAGRWAYATLPKHSISKHPLYTTAEALAPTLVIRSSRNAHGRGGRTIGAAWADRAEVITVQRSVIIRVTYLDIDNYGIFAVYCRHASLRRADGRPGRLDPRQAPSPARPRSRGHDPSPMGRRRPSGRHRPRHRRSP